MCVCMCVCVYVCVFWNLISPLSLNDISKYSKVGTSMRDSAMRPANGEAMIFSLGREGFPEVVEVPAG